MSNANRLRSIQFNLSIVLLTSGCWNANLIVYWFVNRLQPSVSPVMSNSTKAGPGARSERRTRYEEWN